MIENVECPVYPEMARDFKEILGRYNLKEITWDQFNIELCECSVRHPYCIDDFRWKPEPTKTQEFLKWKFLSKEEKEALIKSNNSYVHDKINSYLDAVEHIESLNSRNKKQLLEWLKLKITPESRIKVEEILNTYSGRD
jgi:hypothetical protein